MKEELEKQLTELVSIKYDTLFGEIELFEDGEGNASSPLLGLIRTTVYDKEISDIGLQLKVTDDDYIYPLTMKGNKGILTPIPTDDEKWYKWTVLLEEDGFSFDFLKEEYFQALTLLLNYDQIKNK